MAPGMRPARRAACLYKTAPAIRPLPAPPCPWSGSGVSGRAPCSAYPCRSTLYVAGDPVRPGHAGAETAGARSLGIAFCDTRPSATLSEPHLRGDSRGILAGRQAKYARVVAAELGGALVADGMGGGADALAAGRQQRAGVQQADLLLVLHRAQCRDGLEVAMEGRDAHGRAIGQIGHAQRQRVVAADVADGLVDACQRRIGHGDVAQHPAQRSLQHAVEDFPLVGGRQRRNIACMAHQAQHPDPGIEQGGRHAGHGKTMLAVASPPGSIRGGIGQVCQQAGNDAGIERQADRQIRFSPGGRVHRARRRQAHGHDEIRRRVVVQSLAADRHRLAATQNQIEHGLVHGRQLVRGDRPLYHGDAGNACLRAPIARVRGQGLKFAELLFHAGLDPGRRHTGKKKQKQAGSGQEMAGQPSCLPLSCRDTPPPPHQRSHAMLDHVFLSVSDLDRSIAFYAAALAPLGIVNRHDYDGKDGPPGHPDLKGFGANGRMFFWLKQGAAAPGALHLGFAADAAHKVDAAHAAALAAGGSSIHAPGPQLHYDARYYAAQVRDPDGYSLEFVYKSWQHGG